MILLIYMQWIRCCAIVTVASGAWLWRRRYQRLPEVLRRWRSSCVDLQYRSCTGHVPYKRSRQRCRVLSHLLCRSFSAARIFVVRNLNNKNLAIAKRSRVSCINTVGWVMSGSLSHSPQVVQRSQNISVVRSLNRNYFEFWKSVEIWLWV